ncbi:MAG: DMT family transporter, partial [Burkholderiaceae bacterium]
MQRLDASTTALLIAPPLFWAGNAVIARALVGEFPPLALSFCRWALAFMVLAPFTALTVWHHRTVIREHWRLLAWTGLLGVGCYNSFQYLALQTSTAVNATLIGASGPIITLLVGAVFFTSSVDQRQWVGAGVSLAGVLWVIARGEPSNLLQLQFAIGDLIMLAATLAWSIYTWLLRKQRPPLPLSAFLT